MNHDDDGIRIPYADADDDDPHKAPPPSLSPLFPCVLVVISGGFDLGLRNPRSRCRNSNDGRCPSVNEQGGVVSAGLSDSPRF